MNAARPLRRLLIAATVGAGIPAAGGAGDAPAAADFPVIASTPCDEDGPIAQIAGCVQLFKVFKDFKTTRPAREVVGDFNPSGLIGVAADDTTDEIAFCTGSMIAAEGDGTHEWFLTSAHCLRRPLSKQWRVVRSVRPGVDTDLDGVAGCRVTRACVLDAWIESALPRHDIGIARLEGCEAETAGRPRDRLDLTGLPAPLPPEVTMIGQQPNPLVRTFHPEAVPETLFAGTGPALRKFAKATGEVQVCHGASVFHGASGSAFLTDDRDGVWCVQSDSALSSTSCGAYNECAPLTGEVIGPLGALISSGGADTPAGLTCTDY